MHHKAKLVERHISHISSHNLDQLGDITLAWWCLKSLATWLFVELLAQWKGKENIKAPHWGKPLVFSSQKASNAESLSISWHNHVTLHNFKGSWLILVKTTCQKYFKIFMSTFVFRHFPKYFIYRYLCGAGMRWDITNSAQYLLSRLSFIINTCSITWNTPNIQRVNSMWHSDATIWHYRSWSILVEVMAWCHHLNQYWY